MLIRIQLRRVRRQIFQPKPVGVRGDEGLGLPRTVVRTAIHDEYELASAMMRERLRRNRMKITELTFTGLVMNSSAPRGVIADSSVHSGLPQILLTDLSPFAHEDQVSHNAFRELLLL